MTETSFHHPQNFHRRPVSSSFLTDERLPVPSLLFLVGIDDKLEEKNDLVFIHTDSGPIPVLPFSKRLDFTQKVHQGMGHMPWIDVWRTMSKKCWWPDMKKNIKDWLSGCPSCQILSPRDNIPHAHQHSLRLPDGVFKKWSLDFVGPLPLSSSGNRWLLVGIEHVTRWVIAVPMKEATAENVGRAIYNNILCEFGCPEEILTDRGSNFLADSLNHYLTEQQIRHLKTSAYHPRTNGMVEKVNGAIQRQLLALCGTATHKWDQFIGQALLAIRSRIHQSTGFSPFKLLYGVEPRLPVDPEIPFVLDYRDPKDLVEIRRRLQEDLKQWREEANRNTAEQRDKAAQAFNRNVKLDPLKEKEWVIMRVNLVNGIKTKLKPIWIGPYEIVQVAPFDTYRVRSPEGFLVPTLIHRDRLKRAHIDPDNPPKKLWWPNSKGGEDDSDLPPSNPTDPTSEYSTIEP
jgi:hypothetical protein